MSRLLSALVLAAGEGTRMRSNRPKPLHDLCGRPMIGHVLAALAELPVSQVVVVVGRGGDEVAKAVAELMPGRVALRFVEQPVPRGTGDAVAAGLTGLDDEDIDDGDILIVPSDAPLLRPTTLAGLLRHHRAGDAAATLLVAKVPDPTGYGRILRGPTGWVVGVVEESDADDTVRAVHEINTSVYCFRRSLLAPALRRLEPQNAKGEYYLTDVVGVLAEAGYGIDSYEVAEASEAAGVNDQAQLASAAAVLRDRINERWMRRGVKMLDPESTYVEADVEIEPMATILHGVILAGATVVARGAEVGPECRLVDTRVGEEAVVVRTEARGATVGARARVGPWAVLHPGCDVAPGSVTGPFFDSGAAPGT